MIFIFDVKLGSILTQFRATLIIFFRSSSSHVGKILLDGKILPSSRISIGSRFQISCFFLYKIILAILILFTLTILIPSYRSLGLLPFIKSQHLMRCFAWFEPLYELDHLRIRLRL